MENRPTDAETGIEQRVAGIEPVMLDQDAGQTEVSTLADVYNPEQTENGVAAEPNSSVDATAGDALQLPAAQEASEADVARDAQSVPAERSAKMQQPAVTSPTNAHDEPSHQAANPPQGTLSQGGPAAEQ